MILNIDCINWFFQFCEGVMGDEENYTQNGEIIFNFCPTRVSFFLKRNNFLSLFAKKMRLFFLSLKLIVINLLNELITSKITWIITKAGQEFILHFSENANSINHIFSFYVKKKKKNFLKQKGNTRRFIFAVWLLFRH